MGFEVVHGMNGIGKTIAKKGDCWSFVINKSCAWQTYGFIWKRKGK